MKKITRSVKFIATIGTFLGLLLIIAPDASARYDNPRVAPPNASAYGNTYGEWSVNWWKWAYSMPINQHPLYNTADCSAGQNGKVWFLGGTYTASSFEGGATGIVDRLCTVPAGTALFFPVINSEAATLEGDLLNLDQFGCDASNPDPYTGLNCKARWYQDHAIDLYAEVDGVPINNLQHYRVQSTLFQYGPLPLNNLTCNNGFAAPGVICTDPNDPGNLTGLTSDSAADGVYVMLPPLPVGKHEIKFYGKVVLSVANGDPYDFTFILDGKSDNVNPDGTLNGTSKGYHITVVPAKNK